MIEIGTLDLRRDDDIVRAHQATRSVASGLGFSTFEQTRIATAMSEIARNALLYANGGVLTLGYGPDEHAFEIAVADRGPGIPHLDSVLRGTAQSARGLGLGIAGAQRLMDAFAIDSSPTGTRVEMAKRLRASFRVNDAVLSKVREHISEQLAADPHGELRRLQRDIAERDQRLTELAIELQETNRGVIALHGELEQRAEYQRQAAELKTRLISEMGHELRTPLHSIMSVAQFLIDRLDGELTSEQERQARLIESLAGTLIDYVNDLLDLSKADAGKIPVHVDEVPLERVFRTVRRMMQPLVQGRSATLSFEPVDGVGALSTDESKLSQILRNLVANALKFTERGEVVVSAHAAGGDVRVTVRDTGIGIAPEHLDLIFEEFAQVDSAHHHRVRGTGLGLPLSRRLAELLGGTLTVQSELGVGSTFTLDLPRRFTGEAATPVIAAEPLVTRAEPRVATSRVLVIDDDEASRYVLKRWLSDRFKVEESTGGALGLERARAGRPDAIFLDLVMNDLTGFEVLDRLRGDPSTCDIPVVIYTSLSLGDNDRKRLAAACAIVRKSSASRAADRVSLEEALVSAGLAVRAGASHDPA